MVNPLLFSSLLLLSIGNSATNGATAAGPPAPMSARSINAVERFANDGSHVSVEKRESPYQQK